MKRILTGIRPTGDLHIGHYLSMISELLQLQESYEVFLMIADLHAQTYPFPYKPKELRENTNNLVASLVALGVDPKRVTIFKQSDVPAHLYLYWILGCLTSIGDLTRMHQFKELQQRFKREFIGAGVLMYPVLQAADVLIYRPDLVPVGEDQIQHLELTRELARRFNTYFGRTFKIPSAYSPKETGRIMSLVNPLKKMAKSEPAGSLFIFDDEQAIRTKISQAVTDSERTIHYDPESKPAISNLMVIYKYVTQKTFTEIEAEFKGKGYSEFKSALTEAFLEFFKLARRRRQAFTKEKIEYLLATGGKKAKREADLTLNLILSRTGLR